MESISDGRSGCSGVSLLLVVMGFASQNSETIYGAVLVGTTAEISKERPPYQIGLGHAIFDGRGAISASRFVQKNSRWLTT